MATRLSNNLFFLIIVILLSGCGANSKLASSFSSRKYTPGIFRNNVVDKEPVHSIISRQSEVRRIEKTGQQSNVVSANAPEVIREIHDENCNENNLYHVSKYKRNRALFILKDKKATNKILPGIKIDDPGKKSEKKKYNTVAYIIVLFMLLCCVSVIFGMIMFFIAAFTQSLATIFMISGVVGFPLTEFIGSLVLKNTGKF
jgi:hypothetical protein